MPGLTPNRALIADQDLVTRHLLQRVLERDGHSVMVATDGLEALELCKTHRPQLIISSWNLSSLDGPALCSKLRDDPDLRDVFFLICTSHQGTEARIRALESGANDVVIKPISCQELTARIRTGLRLAKRPDLTEFNCKDREHRTCPGFYETKAFYEIAEHEFNCCRRYEHALSVWVMTIDNLQDSNSGVGQDSIELILHQVVKILKENQRNSDVIGLLPDNKLSVVMPSTDLHNAFGKAGAIRQLISQHTFTEDRSKPLHVTASFGIGCLLESHSDFGTLLNEAQSALNSAQDAGGNRCVASQ